MNCYPQISLFCKLAKFLKLKISNIGKGSMKSLLHPADENIYLVQYFWRTTGQFSPKALKLFLPFDESSLTRSFAMSTSPAQVIFMCYLVSGPSEGRQVEHPVEHATGRIQISLEILGLFGPGVANLSFILSTPPNPHIPLHYGSLHPGGSGDKESACNAGDPGSIPGSGRSPVEGNSFPLQYSCLENLMDRGAWWAIQSMGSQRVGHDWATKHTDRILSIVSCAIRQDLVFLFALYTTVCTY